MNADSGANPPCGRCRRHAEHASGKRLTSDAAATSQLPLGSTRRRPAHRHADRRRPSSAAGRGQKLCTRENSRADRPGQRSVGHGRPAPGEYSTELCRLEILADGRIVVAGQREMLAGASRPIASGIANVMRFAAVDLATAIEMATSAPLRAIGLSPVELCPGEPADLVLFRLNRDGDGLARRRHDRADDCRRPGRIRTTRRAASYALTGTLAPWVENWPIVSVSVGGD